MTTAKLQGPPCSVCRALFYDGTLDSVRRHFSVHSPAYRLHRAELDRRARTA